MSGYLSLALEPCDFSSRASWFGSFSSSNFFSVASGFGASEVLFHEDGSMKGVATNDVGIGKNGAPKDNFERGMEFHAKCTILSEGCRGQLSKQIMKRLNP